MKSEETFITWPKHDATQNTPNRMSWLACTSQAYFAVVRLPLTKEKENTKSKKIIALIVISQYTMCDNEKEARS